ncbi:uncharacterized protein Eint_020770 [Encephalitozoon intestinalis ATCC 50506]|uniref:Uncharacterized protein n=1 Tax=Encephalitozoon intestinalis (strain ATCC 50506) TaxID=876142 RepID=E0S5U1_ENCIT|nr:uncharacterized protein Eint_020770 [Encephalitozoon intestinalis ATCC 50506]ADM11076.1 hypothetical protein Eint_020770 [Encephalitozoon intestinalis ATCC 50506]UTX44728.1 hypothetical protein GPK93_02g02450 [Encephalitozoon intestinalis]
MNRYFCREILLLEEITTELLGSKEMDEETTHKAKLLLTIKDKLNEKMMEMEEYYMKRIEFYRENDGTRAKELEKQTEECNEKYLGLLIRAKELGHQIERLEIKGLRNKSCAGNEL